MRRSLFALVAVAFVGSLFTAADASACHKKNRCAQPCAPACEPAPAPVVETCAPKHKCGFKLFAGMKHHKKACAPVCAPTCAETVAYSAPAPSAQWVAPSAQGY